MKKLTFIPLALLALALQGCVYLRLLEVKGQLADYEKYFSADTSDGLNLTFRQPTLLEKDLTFIGFSPNEIEETEGQRLWKLVFEKKYNVGQSEAEDFSIRVNMALDPSGKLESIYINDRYFAFFSKEQFLSILQSFGGAKIDVKKRTATAQTEDRDQSSQDEPLTRENLITQLGIPFSTTDDNTLEYHFLQKHPPTTNADGTVTQRIERYTASFRFDAYDRFVGVTGAFPFIGTITYSLGYPEETIENENLDS